MKAEEFLSDDFLKQFKTGQQLNDFLGQIQKRAIEKMLEGELDSHLGYEKNEQNDNTNARNGYGKKKIKTSYGESEIKVPLDRDSSFNPMIVPKRESMVEGIEEVIVSLYAKGMSVSDIEEQIKDVYKFEVSSATISRITSRVAEDIVAWQNRPAGTGLSNCVVDGQNSKVVNKTIYIAVGLRRDGLKEVLGMWLGKNESAAYWMSVLTDMKARGLEDILITCYR
jgi:putative transposase